MNISFAQPYDLECPVCHSAFTFDAWVIVDAQERPDLAQAISDLTLHDTICPRCGQTGVVAAPLLYHDAATRAVLFGVPRDMDEAAWREVAQGLLWMLIGALPREQQLPYLGDVQAEAGLAGVAAALQHLTPVPQTAAEALGDALGSEDDASMPPLAEAIMHLLEAQSTADFEALFAQYPFLLDEAMDDGLAGLAEAAIDQGEIAVGQAFERARLVLTQLRSTLDQATISSAPQPSIELPDPPAEWQAAVAALRKAETAADIATLVATYPVLRDQHADAWLAVDEQAIRDVGDLAAAQILAEARALLRGERS